MFLKIFILLLVLSTWPIWTSFYLVFSINSMKSTNFLKRFLVGYPTILLVILVGSWMFTWVLSSIDLLLGLNTILEHPIQWKISTFWLYYHKYISYIIFSIVFIFNEIKVLNANHKENSRRNRLKAY